MPTRRKQDDPVLAMHVDNQRALGRIEETLKHLIGNGQPGIVRVMQDDIESLKESRSKFYGALAALAGLSGLIHYALDKLLK